MIRLSANYALAIWDSDSKVFGQDARNQVMLGLDSYFDVAGGDSRPRVTISSAKVVISKLTYGALSHRNAHLHYLHTMSAVWVS